MDCLISNMDCLISNMDCLILDFKSFWEFFREINLVISAWKNWPKDSHSLLVLMPWKIVKLSLDCIKKESWWQSIHWKIQLIQLVPHQIWRFWKFWLNSVTNCWNKTRKWSWITWTKKCQELHHQGIFFSFYIYCFHHRVYFLRMKKYTSSPQEHLDITEITSTQQSELHKLIED